jgi:hypothetical protein
VFNEFRNLLVAHMMRSVNDRYALLSGIGVEKNVLLGMILENSAWIAGMKAAEHLRDACSDHEIEELFENLKKVDMPDWYKE